MAVPVFFDLTGPVGGATCSVVFPFPTELLPSSSLWLPLGTQTIKGTASALQGRPLDNPALDSVSLYGGEIPTVHTQVRPITLLLMIPSSPGPADPKAGKQIRAL